MMGDLLFHDAKKQQKLYLSKGFSLSKLGKIPISDYYSFFFCNFAPMNQTKPYK